MANLDAILSGAPEAMDALVGGDTDHWQTLAEQLLEHPDTAAASAVVEGLLEREPDVARLLHSAQSALASARSDLFTTTISALRAVRPWLADGIADALPPTHPASLEVRYQSELSSADGGSAAAYTLVADIRRVPAQPRLADALILLARRAHEEGDWDQTIAAAAEADELSSADPRRASMARRLRGAALLSLERFDDAFAILATAMTSTRPPLAGASRLRATPGPRESAIDEAATVSLWASPTTPEWIRALGGMAEHCADEHLWKRFSAALVAMVDHSDNPASDLEVVIRQAGQRDLTRTVQAARALADARGLDPDSEWNPHFG